jgi:hypothetical protein
MDRTRNSRNEADWKDIAEAMQLKLNPAENTKPFPVNSFSPDSLSEKMAELFTRVKNPAKIPGSKKLPLIQSKQM